jgi:ABC-type multidrug transport system fused ATPase/permease subunit
LWQFPLLFISLIGVSFAVSLTEGLGVGLLLPWLTGAHLDLSFLNNVPGLSEKLVAIDGLSVVDRLRIGALILILIMLTRSGLLYLSRLQALRLQIRVTSYLQTNLIQQCHEVAISFLQQQRMGELLERLIQHANQTSLLLKGVAEALVNLFTILTYGLLLAFIS